MSSYRIFTIEEGDVVTEGADIGPLGVSVGAMGTRISIPVEQAPRVPCQWRGRYVEDDYCSSCRVKANKEGRHPENKGMALGKLTFAVVNTSPLKFVGAPTADTDEEVVVVLRTPCESRRGNTHAGTRTESTPTLDVDEESDEPKWKWDPFPGNVLATGRIGPGTQIVALVPRGKVFSARYERRNGALPLIGIGVTYTPVTFFYLWDGTKLAASQSPFGL